MLAEKFRVFREEVQQAAKVELRLKSEQRMSCPARQRLARLYVQQGEAEPLDSFNTRLLRSLHKQLKVHVAVEGRKIQDVVQEALDDYLRKSLIHA